MSLGSSTSLPSPGMPRARSPQSAQQLGKAAAVAAAWPPDRAVRFLDGSLLQGYLNERVPHLVSPARKTYRLREVLNALKEAILEGSLFDPRNPSIVVCDANLERVLGARALHTMEIGDRVKMHLEEVCADEVLDDATAALKPPNPDPAQALLGGRVASIHGITADGDCVSSSSASSAAAPPPLRPPAVGLTVRESFDFDSKYAVTPGFLKVIRTLKEVDGQRSVFSYKELTSYLSRYILTNKERLFDVRNHMVVICKGDLLGEAFGVDAFHRTQVSCLLMHQLLKPEMADSDTTANPTRKRQPPSPEERSAADKKPRRKSGFSVTIEVGYSSDEGEVGEAEASTAAKDGKVESSGSDGGDDDLQVFAFERIYSEEYEPSESEGENRADNNDDSSSSSDGSEIGAVLVASVVFSNETDLAEWADSSDSDADSSDFVLANYDPETESETWRCVNCLAPNTPFIRYCCRCWRERKGWVPDRPKPRRRKRKDKRTEGLPVKKSGQATAKGDVGGSSLQRQRSTASDSGIGSHASQELSPNDEEGEDEVGHALNGARIGGGGRGVVDNMVCTFCCVRPKDATFVHGRISHQVCCYKCAKRLFKSTRCCPVCRRKIEKITKNIVA